MRRVTYMTRKKVYPTRVRGRHWIFNSRVPRNFGTFRMVVIREERLGEQPEAGDSPEGTAPSPNPRRVALSSLFPISRL